MNSADELKNIEILHQKDMKASKAGDYETLRSLFTHDAVIMPSGGPIVRGREQIEENFRQMEKSYGDMEVMEYELRFEEVHILGNYAYEWGTIRGTSRAGNRETEESAYNVMRILQKTENGDWKIHRTIWNSKPLNSPGKE